MEAAAYFFPLNCPNKYIWNDIIVIVLKFDGRNRNKQKIAKSEGNGEEGIIGDFLPAIKSPHNLWVKTENM